MHVLHNCQVVFFSISGLSSDVNLLVNGIDGFGCLQQVRLGTAKITEQLQRVTTITVCTGKQPVLTAPEYNDY